MKISVKFTCPYCGFVQHQNIEQEYQYYKVHPITCDDEEGGCGRLLAISLEVKPIVTVFEMKEVEK
jgi:hypothetical protein